MFLPPVFISIMTLTAWACGHWKNIFGFDDQARLCQVIFGPSHGFMLLLIYSKGKNNLTW
jgi:hypothetical protein